MATKVIETQAIISGKDTTGNLFEQVARKLNKMETAARAANKTMGAVDRASSVNRGAAARDHIQRTGLAIGTAILAEKAAHQLAHSAHAIEETYREFDKERRYARAVMGINDDQQEPLIKQAIHGGATSKFNDIQWLEAQRELAARGLNVDQVRALTEVASKIGMAMDKSLPESVKALEGAMFGFHKDTSTYESAVQNAGRTADLLVKGSKISGMNYDDLVELYKYSATPFRMAHLSEEELLAFGGIGKKSNMGGAEMGTAGRALVANLLSPTAAARTAMLANGIDYSKYQTMNQRPMDAGVFAKDIAMKYGVELEASAKKALQKVFDDKAVISDASKFMPAIMKVLGDELGGDDAKSKKSIAGEARRYRDASVSGVDSERLFRDLMVAIANSPNLANVVFGAKQGARIRTAMGDGELFLKKLDELEHHSQGYADEIAKQRMAGFDGAVSRFEGAVKNLETAVGRALDNEGKGGFLTAAADAAAKFTQSLAEADSNVIRMGVELGAVAVAIGGLKTAGVLMEGFGLKGSAAALDGSAAALTRAAIALGGEAVVPGTPGAAPGAKGKPGANITTPFFQMLLYDIGKSVMDWGFDHLPHPAYPKGYDPKKKADESVLDRLNDIREDLFGKPRPVAKKDFTLGYRGGFNSESPTEIDSGHFGPMSARTARKAGGDGPLAHQEQQLVKVSFEPAMVKIEVNASSQFLAIVDRARSIPLTPHAPDAPGGVGETNTEQR